MYVIYYLLLLAVLLGGLCVNVVNLPGLWVMTLAAAIYAVLTHFAYITLKTLIVLLALALAAEVVDFFAAGAGAKRAGASRRGLLGAIVGGIAGGILFSFILPVIMTLVGVCAGTFAGALLAELSAGKDMGQSVRIGFGAAKGRLAGTMLKLMFGCVMLLVTLWYGWPSRVAVAQTVVRPTSATTQRILGGQGS